MDVILINSPLVLYDSLLDLKHNYIPEGNDTAFAPINLLYLASYLESNNHSVKIIDPTPEGITLDEIELQVELHMPKVIGISAMTPTTQSAVKLARRLRMFRIPIVLGGIHVTNDSGFIDRFHYFDFAITGEGEKSFEHLVWCIKSSIVPQLTNDDTFENLDNIPFPARHLINYRLYQNTPILSSRGCAYNCTFCSIPNSGKKVRYRSAKNIVDEMESIYDSAHGMYSFVDDCLTLSRNHILALCQEIKDRKLKCRFSGATRANCLDEEVVKTMRDAGCIELFFGIESGSERIRNEVIGKRLNHESIVKGIELCKKHGIVASIYLMAGFPTETKKDLWETATIGQRVKADTMGIRMTVPLPGSKLFQYAIDHKIISPTIVDDFAWGILGRDFRIAWQFFVPEGLTLNDLIWFKRITYINFYLHPRWIFGRILLWIKKPYKIKEDIALLFMAIPILIRGRTKGQLS